MSGDTREDQLNELEALRSVYEESRVVVEEGDCIKGRISIELEPLSKPLTVFATCEKGPYSVSLTTLPPANLLFRLPRDYPAVLPELNIECEWMSEDLISNIESKLKEVCEENLGMGVLYFCCETVIEIVKNKLKDMKEICLDDIPYGRKNNLKGRELVGRIVDSSSKSEDLLFQTGCYDCEICFENKMGSQCVRFNPCMHVFCKDCVAGFFAERLNNLEVRELGCPASDCKSTASEQTIRSVIGEEAFERYDRILLEKSLGQMPDVVNCPRKTCQKPVLVSERTVNLGSCTMCGYSFCVLCFRAYHGVDDCNFKSVDKKRIIEEWNTADQNGRAQMAKRFGGIKNLENIVNNLLNDGWMEGNSKPCPRCRVRIEKSDGCNKMQCTKCDAMFCWLCERILDRNDPYAHFNEGGGECVNRLFEDLIASDNEDEEVVVWEDFLGSETDSDTDSEVHFERGGSGESD
uniref:RBR-type E3 ubiquitin transferase n=1 Tax=Haemonchus contortus TaxID=6289 RepID=A0A7I4Y599_HAECO